MQVVQREFVRLPTIIETTVKKVRLNENDRLSFLVEFILSESEETKYDFFACEGRSIPKDKVPQKGRFSVGTISKRQWLHILPQLFQWGRPHVP